MLSKHNPQDSPGSPVVKTSVLPIQGTWVWSLVREQMGLSKWHSSKGSTCQCGRYQRCRFNPRVWRIPWGRKRQPTPVFLPGKFHRQRSLVDYSPWDCKESDTTECLCVYTHRHTHTYKTQLSVYVCTHTDTHTHTHTQTHGTKIPCAAWCNNNKKTHTHSTILSVSVFL